jgi:hypothetical protein
MTCRILAAVFCFASFFAVRIAIAETDCSIARVDYANKCGGQLSCLNEAFRTLDKQVNEKLRGLKGGPSGRGKSEAGLLALKSYEYEEKYRKTFCDGVVHVGTEFWSALEGRTITPQSGLSADERHQLQVMAANCNVAILGEFLYQLNSQYCVAE